MRRCGWGLALLALGCQPSTTSAPKPDLGGPFVPPAESEADSEADSESDAGGDDAAESTSTTGDDGFATSAELESSSTDGYETGDPCPPGTAGQGVTAPGPFSEVRCLESTRYPELFECFGLANGMWTTVYQPGQADYFKDFYGWAEIPAWPPGSCGEDSSVGMEFDFVRCVQSSGERCFGALGDSLVVAWPECEVDRLVAEEGWTMVAAWPDTQCAGGDDLPPDVRCLARDFENRCFLAVDSGWAEGVYPDCFVDDRLAGPWTEVAPWPALSGCDE